MKTPSSDKMNMSAFDEGAIFSSVRRDSEEWSVPPASMKMDPGADGCNQWVAAIKSNIQYYMASWPSQHADTC